MHFKLIAVHKRKILWSCLPLLINITPNLILLLLCGLPTLAAGERNPDKLKFVMESETMVHAVPKSSAKEEISVLRYNSSSFTLEIHPIELLNESVEWFVGYQRSNMAEKSLLQQFFLSDLQVTITGLHAGACYDIYVFGSNSGHTVYTSREVTFQTNGCGSHRVACNGCSCSSSSPKCSEDSNEINFHNLSKITTKKPILGYKKLIIIIFFSGCGLLSILVGAVLFMRWKQKHTKNLTLWTVQGNNVRDAINFWHNRSPRVDVSLLHDDTEFQDQHAGAIVINSADYAERKNMFYPDFVNL